MGLDMVILHSSQSKESRDFVAQHTSSTDTIYDWYKGGREAWIAAGGTLGVRAFPSVIVDMPEVLLSREQIIAAHLDGVLTSIGPGESKGVAADKIKNTLFPAHQMVIDIPKTRADINTRLKKLNKYTGTRFKDV